MLDVIAPKPGNVHRGADFPDMTFLDFALSAVAIAPVIAKAPSQGIGATVLQAIQARRLVTAANTNLGIVLLLAPIVAAGSGNGRREALSQILASLTPDDAKDTFSAIRLAGAGGLGTVAELDVQDQNAAPSDLLQAMELARGRDRIAELYVTDFHLIFDQVLPRLIELCKSHGLVNGLIGCFVELLSKLPDTLILRKCGPDLAQEASRRAAQTLAYTVGSESWSNALRELDFWLRADSNRRNPGTTADIVTATMFVALNDQALNWEKP